MSLVLGFANTGVERDGCPFFLSPFRVPEYFPLALPARLGFEISHFRFCSCGHAFFSSSLAIDEEQTFL